MKKSMIFLAFAVLFFLSTPIFFTACENPEEWHPEQLRDPEIVSPYGSTLTAMEGNVMMIVPEGAIPETVKFYINECVDEHNCPTLSLKMIVIEPLMVFQKPVTLKLHYDGALSYGQNLCDGRSLEVRYWDERKNYINLEMEKKLCCSIDTVDKTLSLCIMQTGVYSIVTNNNYSNTVTLKSSTQTESDAGLQR